MEKERPRVLSQDMVPDIEGNRDPDTGAAQRGKKKALGLRAEREITHGSLRLSSLDLASESSNSTTHIKGDWLFNLTYPGIYASN